MFKGIDATRRKQALLAWIFIIITYHIVWLIPLFTRHQGKGAGTAQAEAMLRDVSQFKWYVIPLLLVVINAYADEIRNKNWSVVLGGLAFFLMDAFNETWNGLFHTVTGGYAAVWQCSFPSAWQPLMGWNIEIILMFLLMGLASTKLLPADRNALVWGKINNRQFHAFIMAWLCVMVEIILNKIGALQWNYPWWQAKFPLILFLIGYWPFFQIAYLVHDLPSTRQQAIVVGGMATVLVIAWSIFIPMGWV